MGFVIRATGGRVILIHVAKQNGYESCLLFSPEERSAKNVSKENVRGMHDELISKKAAIDALRTCYDTETITMDNGDEFINYGDAVGEIEQLPPIQPEPHWIPVTEQPPEVGKSVLICDAYGDICIGHRTMGGYYFPDFCEDKIKDVRAWAELPEPYKGVNT